MQPRVPVDSEYSATVGAAVYVFAYYEWALIHLIHRFKAGFLDRYCRGAPMSSGGVKRELESVLSDAATPYARISREELRSCYDRFATLIDKRNALIHAHPITAADGAQILNYQTRTDRPLPDMKWPITAVSEVLQEFDAAACETTEVLHGLLER